VRLERLGAGEEWPVLEFTLQEDIKDGVKKGGGIYMIYKGIVKGNVIQLEDDVTLPDGMRVTVAPEEPTVSRGLKPAITLPEWLHEARQVRAQLPRTSDSVDILRQLREERARR
jgi:hypothetical protein